jgi:hypothetical protein
MNTVLHLDPISIDCPHRVDVDGDVEFGEVALHDLVSEEDCPGLRTVLVYSAAEALLIGRALVAAAEAVLRARASDTRDKASLDADAAFLVALGA